MSTGRRILLALVAAAAITLVAMLPGPAYAVDTGLCRATIAGVDMASAATPSSAVEVDRNDFVVVQAVSVAPITSYKIQLEFAGVKWTVADGTANGRSFRRAINVHSYAKYGVGFYRVIAVTMGPGACSRSAYVKVVGANPLSTDVGEVAAGMTALGVLGLVVASATAGAGGAGGSAAAGAAAEAAAASATPPGQAKMTYDDVVRAQAEHQRRLDRLERGICVFWSLPALLLTAGMMAGGGGAGSVAGPARLARAHWRPRFSVFGMVTGVLGGLGVVVLLQEYAIAYPTRNVTLAGMIIGLLVGIKVPSLFKLRAVRKFNRAVDAAERSVGARLAQQPVVPMPDQVPASAVSVTPQVAPQPMAQPIPEPATQAAAPVWTPTHVVPAGGMPAWASPDPASPVMAGLDAGVQLQVVESRGAWAWVVASNGWSGWVDGRMLVQMGQ